ncbi:MAG: glycosyltransferase, partial [Thiogranum sp.]
EHWGVDDDYVAEVKEILRTGGFENAVRFAGLVPDAAPYLQAADCFIFPSRREGMPNALLEAMACGLPFVATRLGCIEEMTPAEQQPYLVTVDDADALAEAIIALAHDAGARRRLGAAARRTVEARFSLDAVTDRYVELYRELLENRS